MDDFIFLVECPNGKIWKVFIQIPHNRHSKTIADSLAYGGLWALFKGVARGIAVEEVKMPKMSSFFGLISIMGIEKDGWPVNDVLIYVQLPRFKGGEEGQLLYEMVNQGLGYYLGVSAKKIHVKSAGETIPQAHEDDRILLA